MNVPGFDFVHCSIVVAVFSRMGTRRGFKHKAFPQRLSQGNGSANISNNVNGIWFAGFQYRAAHFTTLKSPAFIAASQRYIQGKKRILKIKYCKIIIHLQINLLAGLTTERSGLRTFLEHALTLGQEEQAALAACLSVTFSP